MQVGSFAIFLKSFRGRLNFFAAVISFLAVFCCIRYKLTAAQKGEKIWPKRMSLIDLEGARDSFPFTNLLARCHSLCVFLTFLGFLSGVVGSISYIWDKLPRSVGISTSITAILLLVAPIFIIIVPSTKTSHIYHV